MDDFLLNLPKIELHAHLNGSISATTLEDLAALKYGEDIENRNKHKLQKNHCTLAECFAKFKIVHELTSTKECLEMATISAIRDFAEDNVIYLELRTTPKNTETMSKFEYLLCVLESISFARIKYPSIIVKLLPSFDRSQGVESAEETLTIVLQLKETYPELIKGIDLSGDPSKVEFIKYKDTLQKARDNGLKLALHCGETPGDEEIKEMLEFGMDRCGHGTLIKGENYDLLKKKNIPVECCLTSNIKCSTVKCYSDHHFGHLFENKHPVVLCTDDFGIFDSVLSNEYKIAAEAFNLKQDDIYTLCMNGVNYSFASVSEKEFLKIIINNYFKKMKGT